MTVTIGADPEFFLCNEELGKIVPACGLLGGTKKKPKRMSQNLKGYTIQEDNVVGEFNIPPSTSASAAFHNLQYAKTVVSEYLKTLGPYLPIYKAEIGFDNAVLDNKQAQTFGCEPDFDAHSRGTQHEKISPSDLYVSKKTQQMRYAGGHIHIGYNSNVPPFVAASFADLWIGLTLVGLDKQPTRRKFYGQPGRYRPTSYGFEYRTPSCLWLQSDGNIVSTMVSAYNLGKWLENSNISKIKELYSLTPWSAVREAISTENEDMAADLLYYMQNTGLMMYEET